MRQQLSETWHISLPRKMPRAETQRIQISTFLSFEIEKKGNKRLTPRSWSPDHVAMGLAVAKADSRIFNTDLVNVNEDTYARQKH